MVYLSLQTLFNFKTYSPGMAGMSSMGREKTSEQLLDPVCAMLEPNIPSNQNLTL